MIESWNNDKLSDKIWYELTINLKSKSIISIFEIWI